MGCQITTTILVIALLLGFSSPAHAQGASAASSSNSAIAEALFNKAVDLMKEKKYAEAGSKLEESNRLDPGLGTRFYLAECYQYMGRIASAWALFVEVADEAERTGQTDRATIARERAKALEARVPKITIRMPETVAKIPGVEVRDNKNLVNAPLWGQSLPVDPGKHTITVTAPGRGSWSTSVDIHEGDTESIDVDEPSQIPIGPIVLGSVGLASIIVGSVFGKRTLSEWDAVVAESCERVDATSEIRDTTKCDIEKAKKLRSDKGVDTLATVSTAMFVVGGVALAGAATWALWPKKKSAERPTTALQVTFVPAPGGGGIVVRGAF